MSDSQIQMFEDMKETYRNNENNNNGGDAPDLLGGTFR